MEGIQRTTASIGIGKYKDHEGLQQVTIDPSSEIQNLNSPIAPTDGDPTDRVLKRRRQYPILPFVNFPWPDPGFVQPVPPNRQVVLPSSRLRVLSRDEMTRHVEADEAPRGERAVAARQVLRLHPESFPVAPDDEIAARRWDGYRL